MTALAPELWVDKPQELENVTRLGRAVGHVLSATGSINFESHYITGPDQLLFRELLVCALRYRACPWL